MAGEYVLTESARREAYDLFHVNKLTSKQIAARMGVSYQTIYKVIKEEAQRRGQVADKQLKERIKILTVKWLEEHDGLAARLQEKLLDIRKKMSEVNANISAEKDLSLQIELYKLRAVISREENELIKQIGDNHNRFFNLIKPMGMLEFEAEKESQTARKTNIYNLFIKQIGAEPDKKLLAEEQKLLEYEQERDGVKLIEVDVIEEKNEVSNQ